MISLLHILYQGFTQSFLQTLGVASTDAKGTNTAARFADLDSELYPITLAGQVYKDGEAVLSALLNKQTPNKQLNLFAHQFSQLLSQTDAYQQWVNFTVYGRYLERSFQAFYQQDEDDFNADMSALFLQELKRHARYLPKQQLLFASGFSQGQLDGLTREQRLLNVTVNPAFAFEQIQHSQPPTSPRIINLFCVASTGVLAVAIKPRQLANQRHRNELLIVDFSQLRLQQEQRLTTVNGEYLLKCYHVT